MTLKIKYTTQQPLLLQIKYFQKTASKKRTQPPHPFRKHHHSHRRRRDNTPKGFSEKKNITHNHIPKIPDNIFLQLPQKIAGTIFLQVPQIAGTIFFTSVGD